MLSRIFFEPNQHRVVKMALKAGFSFISVGGIECSSSTVCLQLL
jgi:hypothetical protein